MKWLTLPPRPGGSLRWLGLLFALLLVPGKISAQACTSLEPPCPANEPPGLTITPEGGTFSAPELDVTVSAFDDIELAEESFRVTMTVSGVTTLIGDKLRFSSSVRVSGGANYNLQLKPDVDNILTTRICDINELCTETSAIYRYTPPPPPPEKGAPAVDTLPHHGGVRVPSPFAAGLGYGTPAYVTRDVPRSLGLTYSSELAAPTGFVQVDVSPNSATLPDKMSIAVWDAAGNRVRFTSGSTENFYQTGSGVTRLAAQWDAGALATGAYLYTVAVRNWWGTEYLETRQTLRVLVQNERQSPFGAGWSVAGLQRLRVQGDGSVVATQGDGSAVFFALGACDAAGCQYTTSPGDFTKLTKVVTRDAAGAIVSEEFRRTNQSGALLVFTAQGRLAAAEDRLGIRTTFGYDAGRLQTVTDPTGKQIVLAYDAAGKLASISDPAGRVAAATVDAAGDLVRITDPDGVDALRVRYDARHRPIEHRGRMGAETLFAYDAAGKLARSTGAQVATSEGMVRPTSTARSWEAAVLPAAGAGTLDFPAARVTPGAARAEVTDSRGSTTRIALDRWGQPVRVEDPEGAVSTWTRNAAGQVTEVTTAQGAREKYTWSGENLIRIDDRITGAHTEFGYGSYGQVDRVWRDEVLQVQSFYDSRGLPDSVRADTSVTRFTHDALGRVLSTTDPEGHRTAAAYEPGGVENTASVTVFRNTEARTTQYAYDALGRVQSVRDPAGRVATTAYDALNRDTLTTGPDSTTVRRSYDDAARSYTLTDSKEQTYRMIVNVAGWVESQTDPRGGVERFVYDRQGNVTTYTNRRGQRVTSTYDALGRLRTRSADGRTTVFGYDAGKLWVSATNEEGTDTLRSDRAGQPVEAVTVRAGRRYRVASSYTEEGLRSAVALHGPWGERQVMSLGYDSIFRLYYFRAFGEAQATAIAYTPDQLVGRVMLPTANATDTTRLRMSFSYTPLHRPDRIGYNRSGVEAAMGRSYGYDVLERIERVVRQSAEEGSETRTLAYDSLGRLARYEDVREWTTEELVCEDPLVPSTCSPVEVPHTDTLRQESYAYDRADNRTDRGAVVEVGNRLVFFGGYTMEYDADGNQVRKFRVDATGAVTYDQRLEWNSLGELVAVTTNGSTTSFGYNGWGQRVRKSAPGGTVGYLWDGDDLVAELDGAGELVREYVYYPGIDQPHSMRRSSDGAIFRYTQEQPGHVAGLVAQGNTVVNTYTYTPWGEPINTQEQVAQPLRYAAREYDAETGLYYVRARYYDPQTGRFISEDPIGLAGGGNAYIYAANDPVNLTDPTGLCVDFGRATSKQHELVASGEEEYCPIRLAGITSGGGGSTMNWGSFLGSLSYSSGNAMMSMNLSMWGAGGGSGVPDILAMAKTDLLKGCPASVEVGTTMRNMENQTYTLGVWDMTLKRKYENWKIGHTTLVGFTAGAYGGTYTSSNYPKGIPATAYVSCDGGFGFFVGKARFGPGEYQRQP